MTGGIFVCKIYIDLEIPLLNFYLVISLASNSQWSAGSGQKHLHSDYEFGSLVKGNIKVKKCLDEKWFLPCSSNECWCP